MSYQNSNEELTKEIEQWITDLESGNYRQGIGKLNVDGCFCCLGVLADKQCGWSNNLKDYEKAVGYYALPPKSLLAKFFLDKDIEETEELIKWLTNYDLVNEMFFNYKHTSNLTLILTTLNDSGKVSFKEIADFLRKFYLPKVKEFIDGL